VETEELARAFAAFLAASDGATSAERVLAHVLATTTHVTATALAVHAGVRVVHDDRVTAGEENLRRLAAGGDLRGRVARAGELLRTVAARLTDDDVAVALPVLLTEEGQVVVDEPLPLLWLVSWVGDGHLPRQLHLLSG
jgi:uncharacterized protein YcgI (DUF1989 family)